MRVFGCRNIYDEWMLGGRVKDLSLRLYVGAAERWVVEAVRSEGGMTFSAFWPAELRSSSYISSSVSRKRLDDRRRVASCSLSSAPTRPRTKSCTNEIVCQLRATIRRDATAAPSAGCCWDCKRHGSRWASNDMSDADHSRSCALYPSCQPVSLCVCAAHLSNHDPARPPGHPHSCPPVTADCITPDGMSFVIRTNCSTVCLSAYLRA